MWMASSASFDGLGEKRDDNLSRSPIASPSSVARPGLSQIFHRKARKDRKGPPYFRKLGRLDCSELSSSTLVFSLVRAGNTGGFSACFASFAVQMQCLGLFAKL